jgi:hypothetical protein
LDHRRPELTKRQKEITRQKKQQEKIDRRNQRHRERGAHPEGGETGAPADEVDDPDIAGIVPGPQPQLEE